MYVICVSARIIISLVKDMNRTLENGIFVEGSQTLTNHKLFVIPP